MTLLGLFAFFACLVLIFILAKWQKTHKKNSQQTQLIERFDLNAKTKAYVIEYHGQQFLIAEHPQALAIHLIPPKGISQDV